jgi:Ricin-type beta-trefoil lectin domain
MLDGDELGRDEKDRVLVRPYIKDPDPDLGSSSTREIPLPGKPAAPPVAVPPTAPGGLDPAADAKDRRIVLWLVGAGIAVVIGAAAVIIALWPSGDGRDNQAATVPGTTLPVGGTGPSAAGSAPSSAGSSASVSASTTVKVSLPAPPAGTVPSGQAPPSQAPPAATLAPPPSANLVGPITGPGGRCLDVGGLGLPGSPATTQACNGTLSQRWTAGTDGTLRGGGGMCAEADGSGVHLVGCGTDRAGQWRAGPNGTLVNLAANLCLTDPDNGTKTGGHMQLAACGGAGQRWVLP